MSERDELADLLADNITITAAVEAILAAGYVRRRVILSEDDLDALPSGSAVQISDDSDLALKSDDGYFRNQKGFKMSANILWRHGAKPLVVLHEPS